MSFAIHRSLKVSFGAAVLLCFLVGCGDESVKNMASSSNGLVLTSQSGEGSTSSSSTPSTSTQSGSTQSGSTQTGSTQTGSTPSGSQDSSNAGDSGSVSDSNNSGDTVASNETPPSGGSTPSNPPSNSTDSSTTPSTPSTPDSSDSSDSSNEKPKHCDHKVAPDDLLHSGPVAVIAVRRNGPAKKEVKIVLKSVGATATESERQVVVDIKDIKKRLATGYGNISIRRCYYQDANSNGLLDSGESITFEEDLVQHSSLFISGKISDLIRF
jgi:hypothetical protein